MKHKLFIILLIFIFCLSIFCGNSFGSTNNYTLIAVDGTSYNVSFDLDDTILPSNYGYFIACSPSYEFAEIYLYDKSESILKVKSSKPSDKDYGGNVINVALYRKSDNKQTNSSDVKVNIYYKICYYDGTSYNWEKMEQGYWGMTFPDSRPQYVYYTSEPLYDLNDELVFQEAPLEVVLEEPKR